MIDWKEFFPVDALAPIVGGLIVWFGLNYIYLAPHVVAPRLAEKYYTPICLSAVKGGGTALAARLAENETKFAGYLQKLENDIRSKLAGDVGTAFGQLGEFGGALLQIYGGGVQSQVDSAIADRLRAERDSFDRQQAAAVEEARRGVRYPDPAAYCRCNVDQGLSNKFDMALYTATARLFRPDGVTALQNARAFDQCGIPPVV